MESVACVCMAEYSKDHYKRTKIASSPLYSSLMAFMMMSLTPVPLNYKKHTQFSRPLSYKGCEACETVIKATAYCLQNLGSELGARCYLILFTAHLFIGLIYRADN